LHRLQRLKPTSALSLLTPGFFPFSLAVMEAKPWNTVVSRTRQGTKSHGGRSAAKFETKVTFLYEPHCRQKVHSIDYLIMSLKISGLDDSNAFA